MDEATVTRQVFEIEKEDIQGLVASAYGRLPCAAYVLLQVGKDTAKAKQWLAARLPDTTVATGKSEFSRVNFAFTHSGLKQMGMSDDELKQFSLPFQQGMVDNGHRSRILGDDAESLRYWRWGATETLPEMPGLYRDRCLSPITPIRDPTAWMRCEPGATVFHSIRWHS